MAPRRIRCSVITGCLLAAVFLASVPGFAASGRLIACADPNNLPFSNRAGQGFENRLAELIAHDLHAKLGYVWWALRRGYVRNTLNTHRCDFWPGVARGIEMLATTQPYYRSDYVFVTRRSEHLTNLTLDDPRLASLKIAVQMVGNDAMNPPPAHALARRHLIDNIRGYMLYGNYTQPNPPAAIINAVARGDTDLAIVWGPLAGYFSQQSAIALRLEPATPDEDCPQWPMTYSIAVGVRRNDEALRAQIDQVLLREQPAINALLSRYHIPVLPLDAASPLVGAAVR